MMYGITTGMPVESPVNVFGYRTEEAVWDHQHAADVLYLQLSTWPGPPALPVHRKNHA